MTKLVYLNLFGIEFTVEVEYEEEDNKVYVCGVTEVYVGNDSTGAQKIKCNTEEFYKSLDGELQEALEEAISNDKIVAAEARYDAMKEEGLLK